MKAMNTKKLLALLALGLTLGLAGCGASSSSSSRAADTGALQQSYSTAAETDTAAATGETADAKEAADTEDADSGSVYDSADVKLIRRATLSVEATDLDAACASLEALAKELGGYLESSSLYQGSYGTEYRSASYTVRVPSDQYDAFLSGVEADGSCHLVSREESTEDVGQEYADTETHITALKTKLERLNELMEQAESMEDIITIESAIAETEQELESYSSDLNRYDDLIDYATINVDIDQVEDLTEVEPERFTARLATAFLTGCGRFWDGLQDFAVWVAGNIWSILLLLLLIFLALRLRSWRKKRRASSGGGRKPHRKGKKKNAPGAMDYHPAYRPQDQTDAPEAEQPPEEPEN